MASADCMAAGFDRLTGSSKAAAPRMLFALISSSWACRRMRLSRD